MQKVSSWRELLEIIIGNTVERSRIAAEIGVRPLTLTRWINGESLPRTENLRHLINALPDQYRDQFQELLEQDYPQLFQSGADSSSSDELPYTFISEVLETRSNSPDILRFWAISRQILQHALKKLDPLSLGLAITVAQCMPPQSGKIRSLRERTGMGTHPWPLNLDEQGMFLGAESLAGYVATSGHYAKIDDLRVGQSLLPAYQAEYEVSAVAYPLMYAQRIAGCLLISSTQPNYFNSPARLGLVQGYTHLMSLAFEPEEFYPQSLFELSIMPSFAVQRSHFAGFRQRIVEVMKASSTAPRPLTSLQAEQIVWQQIEEAFVRQLPE